MSSPQPPQLTTTSYAILGLLAIRPWTTYELAQHMDRSLRRLWPRAVSKVYEEPKKLAKMGLATARSETTGRRPRTVYSITPRGRRALANWLATPTSGRPVLEFEALLKIFFGESGSKSDLLATLDAIREWSISDLAEHIDVARAYAAGNGAFPERVAQVALVGRFIFEFSEMVGRWATWATAIVEQWPDDPRQAEPAREVFELVASLETSQFPRPLDAPTPG